MRRKPSDDTFDFNKQVTFAHARHTTCCGMCELNELQSGPVASLAALAAWQEGYYGFGTDFTSGNFKPMVIFSDRVNYQNGEELAEFIRAKRLGNLVTIKPVRNPNSGYNVQGWLWRIDKKRWNAWVKKHIIWEGED